MYILCVIDIYKINIEAVMIEKIKQFNLYLRVLMEVGIIIALGYWGFTLDGDPGIRMISGFGAPLIGFGFWGLIDFHQFGSVSEFLRLAQELAVSGMAAWAWYMAGQHIAGGLLAGVSVVHHSLVYLSGERLLRS
jgi:hypothetical protein